LKLFDPEILATGTIWTEAQGEALEGKLCVGEVIRQRMKQRYSSDGTVAGTVARSKQFSAMNDDRQNNALLLRMLQLDYHDPTVIQCREAWLQSAFTDYSNGAVLYHGDYMNAFPEWVVRCRLVAHVGKHLFYVEAE
jgi:spore germination cell wall hydrolase CwlJ-like protein